MKRITNGPQEVTCDIYFCSLLKHFVLLAFNDILHHIVHVQSDELKLEEKGEERVEGKVRTEEDFVKKTLV